jgi:hypothetical protein
MNCRRETVVMGMLPGNRRGSNPRRTLTVRLRVRGPRTPGFLPGEPTTLRDGRPYVRSQQVIHEICGLGMGPSP